MTKINVSNGEHYFSKDEMDSLPEEVRQQIYALAPNAKNGGREELLKKAKENKTTTTKKTVTGDGVKKKVIAKKDVPTIAETKKVVIEPTTSSATKTPSIAKAITPSPAVEPNLPGTLSGDVTTWENWSNQNWDPTTTSEADAKKEYNRQKYHPMIDPSVGVPVTEPITTPTTESSTNNAKSTNPLLNRNKEKADNGIAIMQGVAALQAGIGATQLMNDGPRPVDTLDPDQLKAVETARIESKFGISAQEREIANTGIERTRRAGIATTLNLGGGNAGNMMGNIAAQNIGTQDAYSNLALGSEKLRLDKTKYYTDLVLGKAAANKQLFNEKLGAFEQDQTTGGQMMASGISNYIGSLRYKQQLASDKTNAAIGATGKMANTMTQTDIDNEWNNNPSYAKKYGNKVAWANSGYAS